MSGQLQQASEETQLLQQTARTVAQMDKKLFGEDGNSGFVAEVHEEHRQIRRAIADIQAPRRSETFFARMAGWAASVVAAIAGVLGLRS